MPLTIPDMLLERLSKTVERSIILKKALYMSGIKAVSQEKRMKIYLCMHAGLCQGAQVAVDTAYENLSENLYMYGEVLHNPTVISQLKEKGAKIIRSVNEVRFLENKKEITVLIRAHGVAKSVIDALEEEGIHYLDRTCKEVKKIHDIVAEKSRQGYRIIIVGSKTHPEVVGTAGWVMGEPILIQDMEEAKNVIPALTEAEARFCVVAQTTYNFKKYREIIEYCKENLQKAEYFNTVCMDTENRQTELAKLSRQADAVIVIGGKNSSNSNKLYKIALKYCRNVQFIETYKELDFSGIDEKSFVVIASGASTPEGVIDQVKECLRGFSRDMKSPLV